MISILDRACIVGVGETVFRRDKAVTTTDLELQLEAASAAIADAGLLPDDIDGLICPMNGGKVEDFVVNLGIRNLGFAVTSHTGGAAPVAGLASAAMAIGAGLSRHVLIPAGWRGFSGPRARGVASGPDMAVGRVVRDYYAPHGAVSAVHQYALVASQYVHTYGVSAEATGAVAVTFRQHAQKNPSALMFGRELTIQDYLTAPPVSSPFGLFDCSLETDGAGAIVVSSTERARDLKQPPVFIMSVREGRPYPLDDLANRADLLQMGLTQAAPLAFRDALLKPADVDLFQVYDSFTVNVLRQLEEAGFCARGEASDFVLDGHISAQGSLPTNVNGGMLSEAHVHGMNNLIEAVRQLRGAAGSRQLQRAAVAAVTGMGGGWGSGAMALLRR